MTYIAETCSPVRRRFSLLSLVADRIALMQQGHALANLDCRALEDIGINRTDALKEAQRPIWDAPEHWACK